MVKEHVDVPIDLNDIVCGGTKGDEWDEESGEGSKNDDDPGRDVGECFKHLAEDARSELRSEVVPFRTFHVPILIRAGGALLAFCAGIVNVVALYALLTYVSHVTGTLTRLGNVIADPNLGGTTGPEQAIFLLLSFVLGSTVCGCFIGKSTIHFGLALYDFGLLSVSGLLVCATFSPDIRIASYFASAACGLQNGLATQWGGAVIRTTHVTGLATDVGLLIGRVVSMLARKRCGQDFDPIDYVEIADDLSKLTVLTGIAAAFLVGVVSGAYLYKFMGKYAFLVPAGITGTIGLLYFFYRVIVLKRHVFDNEEMELVDVPPAPLGLFSYGANTTLSFAPSIDEDEEKALAHASHQSNVNGEHDSSHTAGVHLGLPSRTRAMASRNTVISVPRAVILQGTSPGLVPGNKCLGQRPMCLRALFCV